MQVALISQTELSVVSSTIVDPDNGRLSQVRTLFIDSRLAAGLPNWQMVSGKPSSLSFE
jgi:hypothetical protein